MDKVNEYYALIERVAKIDPKAALYMRDLAIDHDSNFSYMARLSSSFVWLATPQGADYWENIDRMLTQ